MAKVRAYVYKYETTSSGVSYKVFPPVVILGKGDKLEVVNTVADFDALLTVPAGVFEGGEIKKKPVAEERQIHHQGGRRCGIYRRRVRGRGRWKEGNGETPIP